MLTTIIASIACTSGGYLFGAIWAAAPLQRRLRSLHSDLADAAEALSCRDQALAAHMAYVGDQRRMLITKSQIIDDLEAEVDRLGDLRDKWVPVRNDRGHFLKKVG